MPSPLKDITKKSSLLATNNIREEGNYVIALLHIATFLLSLPATLMLGMYFKQPAFYPFLALPFIFLWLYWPVIRHAFAKRPATYKTTLLLVSILPLALFMTLLSGYWGIFGPTMDMPKHILLFKELAHNTWPVVHYDCEDTHSICPNMLRYALGFYIIPSLVGTYIPSALTPAIAFITMAFYGMLLWVLASYLQQGRTGVRSQFLVIASLLAFVFFGDGSTLYAIMMSGAQSWFLHHEAMINGLEYSSNITLFRHVPQHAIPSFYAALFFIIALKYRSFSLVEFAFPALIILTWSPFIFIGFCLLGLIYTVVTRPSLWPQKERMIWIIFTLLVCFGVFVLCNYYALDAGNIPSIRTPNQYLLFLLYNVGPILALLYIPILTEKLGKTLVTGEVFSGEKNAAYCRHRAASFYISALLIVIPFVKVGYNNDFIMRVSAPLLMVLKCFIIMFLLQGRWRSHRYINTIIAMLLIICIADGVSQLFYPGIEKWRNEVLAFDPSNSLSAQDRKNMFAPQYYAFCHPTWFIKCDAD